MLVQKKQSLLVEKPPIVAIDEQSSLGTELPKKPKNGIREVRLHEVLKMLVPAAMLFAAYLVFMLLPNVYPKNYAPEIYGPFLLSALFLYCLLCFIALHFYRLRNKLVYASWMIAVFVVLMETYDVLTLKTGILTLPFCPSPNQIIKTFCFQFSEIMKSMGSSLELLWLGILIGSISGFISGALIGWSSFCDYWVMGLLRIIGPIPPAVWIPISMTLMPSSHAAGLFIISLAVWSPLTLMFGSAIKNTEKKYIEVARCLGAKRLQLFFRVALPNALPGLFNGFFMGIASSFGALVVVEMIGAQAGLGFLINWAKSWAQFDKMFGVAIVLVVLFSTIIAVFFRLKNHFLQWQDGSKEKRWSF